MELPRVKGIGEVGNPQIDCGAVAAKLWRHLSRDLQPQRTKCYNCDWIFFLPSSSLKYTLLRTVFASHQSFFHSSGKFPTGAFSVAISLFCFFCAILRQMENAPLCVAAVKVFFFSLPRASKCRPLKEQQEELTMKLLGLLPFVCKRLRQRWRAASFCSSLPAVRFL